MCGHCMVYLAVTVGIDIFHDPLPGVELYLITIAIFINPLPESGKHRRS